MILSTCDSDNKVTMYGAELCGDCRRSKEFLDSNNVNYTFVNVKLDEIGKLVEIFCKQSIPVIAFSDGTFMVEPSDIDLKKNWKKSQLFN